MPKVNKPKLPTTRESLAKISDSLTRIAKLLETGLYSANGDCALENIQYALYDIAEYGPGKVPKKQYAWRHSNDPENQ
jgi:hypothetical protein